jgi:hypothetical protein
MEEKLRFDTLVRMIGGNHMNASGFDRLTRASATSSRRSVLRGLVGAALGVGVSFVVGPKAIAQTAPPDAATICRLADEAGSLDPFDITRGECLNALRDPSSSPTNAYITGTCGDPQFQSDVGVTSKGACIKLLESLS